MSVIDDLRTAQQHALARLDELKPLVAEYEELRAEVERLKLIAPPARTDGANGASTTPRSRATKPRQARAGRRAGSSASAASATAAASRLASAPAKRTAKRATTAPAKKTTPKPARTPGGSRSSSRADDIARLVAQQPGMTVADLSRSLGVGATSLYSPVRRLVSDGRLRKDGTALHPAA